MPLPERKDAKSLAAEPDGSAVGMLCLGMQQHTTGVGWTDQEGSASPLCVLQECSPLYLLVLRLIHVQLTTTHQEPIQLKTDIFLRFLFCNKLTSLHSLQHGNISISAGTRKGMSECRWVGTQGEEFCSQWHSKHITSSNCGHTKSASLKGQYSFPVAFFP